MSVGTAEPETASKGKPAVVKKYANRRLYNTATSSYVTLDELSQMVRKGEEFVVFDAKTGEDITRSVLTQIILEEDSKGRNLLPIGFLRHVIGFYDDSLQSFLPRYLELSMENFARHQDQMRGYVEQTFGRFFPLTQLDDMTRQNMALFQRAASMFRPFPNAAEGEAGQSTPEETWSVRPAGGVAEKSAGLDQEMRELRHRMESLQEQLEALQKTKPAAE
ncbi:MAG: polyhydroxyalkanoate synthesis repressor PhaR [Geminicoccaceae bacterium]